MWDKLFEKVSTNHQGDHIGVFYCGPKGLGHDLSGLCRHFSDKETKFAFYQEHFWATTIRSRQTQKGHEQNHRFVRKLTHKEEDDDGQRVKNWAKKTRFFHKPDMGAFNRYKYQLHLIPRNTHIDSAFNWEACKGKMECWKIISNWEYQVSFKQVRIRTNYNNRTLGIKKNNTYPLMQQQLQHSTNFSTTATKYITETRLCVDKWCSIKSAQ